MKNKIIVFILFIAMLTACNNTTTNEENNNNNNNQREETKEYSNLKQIDYKQFTQRVLYKDTFVLVGTQTSCSHCHSYKPVLNSVLSKYDIIGYELDFQKLDDETFDVALDALEIETTPQTLFFIDGVEQKKYRLDGEATAKEIEDILIKLKYVGE